MAALAELAVAIGAHARASDSMWHVLGDVDGRSRRTALLRARSEVPFFTASEFFVRTKTNPDVVNLAHLLVPTARSAECGIHPKKVCTNSGYRRVVEKKRGQAREKLGRDGRWISPA